MCVLAHHPPDRDLEECARAGNPNRRQDDSTTGTNEPKPINHDRE